jgi:predicted ATPase/DNA-binding SARP family transcriptional activator
VDIRVLGPLEVRDHEDVLVTVPGGQQRALVALLAMNPGVAISAERLVDELWGDATPQQPANALHVVVSKLRRAIGAETVERRSAGYCLTVAPEEIDACRFERLVGQAGDRAAAGDPPGAVALLDEALALWRGAALEEFPELRTAVETASRLEEVKATAVEQRIAAMLAAGRTDDVVHDALRAVAQWPYRERLRAHLMLALYRSGRQADALRAFSDARDVLAEELGLDPSPELSTLEAAILAHDPSLDGPAASTPTGTASHLGQQATRERGNLRASLTSFVGRDADLQALDELVRQHRLVSLVGPGGFGKTRLALEFGRSRTEAFDGGVWLIALDSISSGASIDGAVASAFGFGDSDLADGSVTGAASLLDRLVGRLSNRRALIVIDNCEHVIDDAAALAVELVERLPELVVLATSRESLRVAGEAVWILPPLDRASGAALFADRARAASPRFDAAATIEVVERLCAELDGMPLAIELIAARANAFTVEQMQERLADRLESISAGTRRSAPRHQTLSAVTHWSHDLLFEAERATFRRLSIFAGGCTLEAAEAVCGVEPIDPFDVAETLARLIDKSLVIAEDGRYRMLLTLAEYGRARLAEAGELESTSRRAAHWFAERALRSFSDWRTPGGRDQAWWMRRINADLDNVRRALEWSIAHVDSEAAGRLAGGLGWYWWHTGRAAEGVAWLDRVFDVSNLAQEGTRGLALTWLARLCLDTGDYDRAKITAGAALEALSADDDPALESLAEFVLSRVAVAHGQLDVARSHARRSTAAQARVARPWNQGITAVLKASEAALCGDHTAAERELATATSLLRNVGDVAALVLASHQLLRLQLARHAYDDSDRTARDAIALAEQYGLQGWVAVLSNELGAINRQRGDASASREHHAKALHLARELGLATVQAAALEGLMASRHDRDSDLGSNLP